MTEYEELLAEVEALGLSTEPSVVYLNTLATHVIVEPDGALSYTTADAIGEDDEAYELPAGFHDYDLIAWTFDRETHTHIENVAAERERLWAFVKADRDALIDGGLTIEGVGTVQTNKASRDWITSLWSDAQANPSFTCNFRLLNNTTVPLDGAGIETVKVAVSLHVQTLMDAAQSIWDSMYLGSVETLPQLHAISRTLSPE